MKYKGLLLSVGLVVTVVAVVTYVWVLPVFIGQAAPPAVAAAVEAVVRQSVVLDSQVAHTLDLTPLATVYINDPCGGPLAADTIAYIRAAHLA